MSKNESRFLVDKVWYSNEKRMKSIWKPIVMDDRGIMNISKNKIQYVGKKNKLDIDNIKNIYITKQTPNYGIHFISFIISILIIAYTFLILISSIEFFIIFLVVLIILIPLGIFGFRLNWIGIEYIKNGDTKKAFFTDGSALGWKNALKGSNLLFNNIKSNIKILKNKI